MTYTDGWQKERDARMLKRVMTSKDVAVTRKYRLHKRWNESICAKQLREDLEALEKKLSSYKEANDEYHINIIDKMIHGKKVLLHNELNN